MYKHTFAYFLLAVSFGILSCKKSNSVTPLPVADFTIKNFTINNNAAVNNQLEVSAHAILRFSFSTPVNKSTAPSAIQITTQTGTAVAFNIGFEKGDSTLVLTPQLSFLQKYSVTLASGLQGVSGKILGASSTYAFTTSIDSSRKFPPLTDDALLTKIQEQTFKYFWDFGHPTSGMARERSNGDNNVVTSGGTGFGIMAIPVAIERGFITRQQGLERTRTIVSFLKSNAVKVKGAFSHWINGTTGAIVPFSTNDNGADLVETSFLMMGLLTARQYFDAASELQLRNDITQLYEAVEWNWFRRGNENVLYWHYSADKEWAMNLPIKGWNECLVTYVLAASSPTHGIPKEVYDKGWAGEGSMKNGNTYMGYTLPLGEPMGGPLFLSQYSFLGINPFGLSDTYANYETQVKNHSLINYNYCISNPKSFYGYSDSVWGLTASDIKSGYTASSPNNDVGFIAPTAAVSALPFTPAQSMAALKFYYYVLGDKLFKDYGFIDAFSLSELWFASSHLAIDQGPQIIMIENHRTKLVWNLFMGTPEVKQGMRKLGFTAPDL